MRAHPVQPAERSALGLPPLPLTAAEVEALVGQLVDEPGGPDACARLAALAHQVPPGVDDAARVKARFLQAVATGAVVLDGLLPPEQAVVLLGTMLGGYNVAPLVGLLDDRGGLADAAARELAHTVLVFDAFGDVADRARLGNRAARQVLEAWADGTWLHERPALPPEVHARVFRVAGEITTDDLSPAPEAWSRPDIPLHAMAMLASWAGGDAPAEIARLRALGRPVVFVGDVVGTGSSRKSAVNSLLWHIGHDIGFVPARRTGGIVLGSTIAPIFANTLRDAGALALEGDVGALASGDHLVVRPFVGRVERPDGTLVTACSLRSPDQLDEVTAGGRMTLILGRSLTAKARDALGRSTPTHGARRSRGDGAAPRWTLAQKIVGRACGLAGVAPGQSCQPTVSTVGSQDTTGPMNRTELRDLACLHFSADLVLQTFCHTAAYPKPVDIETQRTLPAFMGERGAVVLRPGDGIIHSWLNQLLLPDQVGTGSDSHTRFPLGISFPAGSGLVAFAAALGVMPLEMPESVLVRIQGARRPGITLRDVVHAIPFVARQQGLLTLDKQAKSNVFAGRIVEIEGLQDASSGRCLTVGEAFELTDATAERSAAAATIALSEAAVADHLRAGVALLHQMIDAGYEDAAVLRRRADAMKRWLDRPTLLRADPGASYAAVVDVDLAAVTEPLLACPNDPDDVRPLSAVAGTPVDEVFIGSCMTSVAHFRRAAAVLAGPARAPYAGAGAATADGLAAKELGRPRLWLAPPTAMAEAELREEGHYATFAAVGARTEVPGCSLCMGNQARVAPGATVVSTSTRNYPGRMGDGANVYLASAEVASVAARLGALPTVAQYQAALAAVPVART